MAVSKSSPCHENPLMRATRRIDALLADFFASRPLAGKHLCIALSGGIDSVVLLHAMHRLHQNSQERVRLSAVHVHHGLSRHADDWADFCFRLCQNHGVPCEVVSVCVPRNSGEGLEAAARRLRYGVFEAVEADALLLAHHRADQSETVLLNLLRGAGVAGAVGMRAERPQSQGAVLWRPLLEAPRSLIDSYAEEYKLPWVTDESNDDRHYRRNFLRHDIFPQLEGKFPGAEKSLARAAGHFAEAACLLDDLAILDKASTTAASGRLALASFNALPPARARNLLRHVWSAAGFRAPEVRWVDEALKQLVTAEASSEVCLSTLDGELRVYRGELFVVSKKTLQLPMPVVWSGQSVLPWAGSVVRFYSTTGKGVRQSLFTEGTVRLMPRQGGERLQPDAKRPRRRLRNLLQESAVPPWVRSQLPLLWVDERLAWVGGIGHDASLACPPGENGVFIEWDVARIS